MASSMLTAEVSASGSKETDIDEALESALHSCANDPDFAIICDFLQKFSKDLGLDLPNFKSLLIWLTKTDDVSPQLRDMQIKLLRKTRKTVHEKSWESALSKFCFTYSAHDAWEVERFGYKNSSFKVKLRILRELLECQFERNNKFRAKILTLNADSLRSKPIGRDSLGHAYWVTQDSDCNIHIYQEHLDEELWQVVATNREEFVNLIKRLKGSEVVLASTDIGLVDEDTSSSSINARIDSDSAQKEPPPEEKDDSQEDEQKVPKLSIKLVHSKNVKETIATSSKDFGKGEEELAAEEDAKQFKKSQNNESCDDEFEEVEEEYDDESDSGQEESEDNEDDFNKASKKLDKEIECEKSKENKKVKPLLISQKKILTNEIGTTSSSACKKRALDQMEPDSPPRSERQQASVLKKSRPSILDSKRAKTENKYLVNTEDGEEEFGDGEEETDDEDSDVEEEIEEEDIDSVAAEEDENEEKNFEDYDEDEENQISEEISDPVVRVIGEGSGKDCDVGNYLHFIDYDLNGDENKLILSEVIVENICYTWGEGRGEDCLVGNKNNDDKNNDDVTDKNKANTEMKIITEPVSESQLEKGTEIKIESKSNFILSPNKPILNDNITGRTTGITSDLEGKQETAEENTNQNIESNDEVKKQIPMENTKGEINGKNKPEETISAETQILENEKQSDVNKVSKKLPLSDNIIQSNEKAETPSSKEVPTEPSIFSKADSDVADVMCEQTHANKMFVLESLKKELRESKQKLMEKKSISTGESNNIKHTNPSFFNRKRRLTNQLLTTTRSQNSESEIDINSENAVDITNHQDLSMKDDDDVDVGGKRLKMRPKQTNNELRKKIEAQKAANDETTSSSGGEEDHRRRKKVILPKQTATDLEQTINTSEESKKEINKVTNSTNERPSAPEIIQHTVSEKKQITPTKIKPTLDEIIEKKLKKTPEKDSTITTAKNLFPCPNKNPITKPLKKNLITQKKQEESDEGTTPRKRTNSQDLSSQTPSEQKTESTTSNTITLDSEKQRSITERQRKRRSSEETTQQESPEEPEAKKEVTTAANDATAKRDKANYTANEEIDADVKEIEISKEPSALVTGRRSGRRVGVASAQADSLQMKRNRSSTKNATEKELNDCDKIEEVIKEEAETKQTKINEETLKQDIKEKNNVKMLGGKSTSSIKKDNDSEDVETQKKPNEIEMITTSAKSETPKAQLSLEKKTPVKGARKKREVDTTNIIDVDSETPVRQSRRIAQQKIREEAERRKLEEIALRTMKQELKKKKKAEKQTDPTVIPPTEPSSESEESDVEIKRKVQKKKCPGKNGNWSSGSEEQEEPDEEEEEPHHYETDPGSPLFRSDHEFSPESDIEDASQAVPMKRARTVRKEDAEDDVVAADEEEACQKCNKSDHPEWILLCDNCDKGYHCSCLSPVLFYIPEGDWYCPPCQQEQLIRALEIQLKEFDSIIENKKKEEEEQVKRLAEEEKARQQQDEEETKNRKNKEKERTKTKNNNDNSSAEDLSHDEDNETSTNSEDSTKSRSKKQSNKNKHRCILKNNDKRNKRNRRSNYSRNRRNHGNDSDKSNSMSNSNSSSSSSSSSSSYSDSDNEPIYKLRKRRQINVSYRLNEYDDLINSALKKEMDEAAGAGNLGRGKDISTIIEADKEEKARQKQIEDDDGNHKAEIEIKPKAEVTDEKENLEEVSKSSIKSEPKESTIKGEKKDNEVGNEDEDDSDAEPIIRKFNVKQTQKKKPRKLTKLDISSEDDNGSDEDFKGSSFEDDDDEEDTSISASNSDSSLDIYKRHGKSKKKRRKAARRAFRERRKDRRFVVDESDDEDIQRPKSKKKRKDDSDYTESEVDDDDISELSENIDSADLCDDTTTDESDGAWRPNKRKQAKKGNSNSLLAHKSPKSKSLNTKKSKKVEYSDDDISESDEDDDDENEMGSGKGMGKQPRSQPLKTVSNSTKSKGKGKEKPPAKTKTKKKTRSSDDDEASQSDSEDSTRRTRGRRYAYIEDFDDDSSDGGIKPGVQRPDTPPEEREKFIKRQEEIKRMLAEKNAEGAKLVATPRLTPIKTDGEKDKRSPAKPGGDSLSTVPLSVIRQAKVLDIDYLQRRGENLDDLSNDVGEVNDDFDDADLPDDLPEDMDEDAIARMVEEEEEFGAAAARDLPSDEVLRTSSTVTPGKIKDIEKPPLPNASAPCSSFPTNSSIVTAPVALPTPTSALQEPVRKRLPMPTMHPPLLRHQFLMHESLPNTHHLMQRHHGRPPPSHLLQNALSAPLTQSLDRNYPPTTTPPSHHSLINRVVHSIPLQTSVSQAMGATRTPQGATENKPRGRRKKITPLRDTLQKQQTAAAVTAATATNAALASAIGSKNNEPLGTSIPSSVIKSGLSAAKLPTSPSVIAIMPPTSHPASSRPVVSMPPIGGSYVRAADGPRFYDSPGNRIPQTGVHRHRGGPPHMPPSLLPPHPANRSSYGPPPPLKGSSSGPSVSSPSSSINTTPGAVRTPMHHVPSYLGMPPNTRHAPAHLNMYRPPIYGNPNFGPRINLRPPNIHGPEYTTGSRAYPPYGFYPPPPPLTTPGSHRSVPSLPPRHTTQMPPSPLAQLPASVIVSAAGAKSSNTPKLTPPPTPETTELSPSSKSSLLAHDLPSKLNPPKTLSPTTVITQTEKSLITTVATAVSVAEPRKQLTTLETYSTNTAEKSPVRSVSDSPKQQSPSIAPAEANDDASTPGPSDNAPTAEEATTQEGQASEFSGLVSYFSSQHDDYNT